MKNLENLINETINNHSYIKVNQNIYLQKYQLEILDYYHIPYQNCTSLNEILFLIEDVLQNEELEDSDLLESVASSIQEINYYHFTNK